MQKKSVCASTVVACLWLAISLGCSPDETARPFGREGLGTSPGGNGGDPVSDGGAAGLAGTLGVMTGSGTGGTGGAGSANGAAGGTAGINNQLMGGKGGGGSRDGVTGSGGATVSGSGGAVASGTGGTAVGGTGGATGSGGAHGSGGATSSGGATGTGGATSSGGATGTGGASGTGGAIGTSAACTQHILDYDAELQSARVCKANMAKACALLVPVSLSGCGRACLTYVDKATKLAQIETQWAMDGCTAAPCPVEVCVNPVSSICSVATGLCTDL